MLGTGGAGLRLREIVRVRVRVKGRVGGVR